MWGFTWPEIAEIVDGQLENGETGSVPTGASHDTRHLKKGDLFFAFSGEKTDGHNFLSKAYEKGAAGAVVTRRPQNFIHRDFPLILVKDPLTAIGQLAMAQRQRFAHPVIAITGSVGKTTTKEIMAALLAVKGPVLKTWENYNNEIGVPLTILSLKPEHRFLILEMGMRALGEIDYLCQISQPDYGIITNLGYTHAELLGSLEKIAEAKAELLVYPPQSGKLALPIENRDLLLPWLPKASCSLSWFGITAEGDFRARQIIPREKGFTFTLEEQDQIKVPLEISLWGKHNVINALGPIIIARALGLSFSEIQSGLQQVTLPTGRLCLKNNLKENIQIIDDTYNANPDSAAAALEVLKQVAGTKRALAVLGSMNELGTYSEQGHFFVGQLVKKMDIAYLITVGELGPLIAEGARLAGMSEKKIEVCTTNEAALNKLAEIKRPGDVILVKGSRGVGMEEIVVGLMA